MTLCTFADSRCTVCGAPRVNVRQLCGTWHPGLGDMLAAGLASVGITPERVASALGVEDCGCEGRQQLLNDIGNAIGIGNPPVENTG